MITDITEQIRERLSDLMEPDTALVQIEESDSVYVVVWREDGSCSVTDMRHIEHELTPGQNVAERITSLDLFSLSLIHGLLREDVVKGIAEAEAEGAVEDEWRAQEQREFWGIA